MGRPTEYTEEKADYIAGKISEGITLADICREDSMPHRTTVYYWMEKNEAFSLRIARARVAGFDAIADECLAIADDTTHDTIKTEKGAIPDTEWIQRSKLRVETRLKLLAKWDPKRYGDKLDVTSDNKPLGTTTTVLVEIVPPKDDDE